MTTYSYTALDPAGKKKSGFIEAADSKTAIAKLQAEGRFVTEIHEKVSAEGRAKMESSQVKRKSKATKSDVALFTRRMADLSSAGLPLDRVLQVLAEQSEVQPLVDAAENALEDVRGGVPVSEALAKNPKLFPPVFTMTLSAGEASGQFGESAERLAELLENEVARRSQVISALVYPAILASTAVLVVVGLLVFVVPRLGGVFADMGDDLPATTKILLGTAGFITSNWILIIVALIAAFIGYRLWESTPAGAFTRDMLLMKAPIFGPIVSKAVVARYSRVLGTLIFGGVPILDALRLAGLAAGNRVFLNTSAVVESEVREGVPMAQAMKDTGVFPPVLTHMVAIGEETGNLPKMLDRVSSSLEFEVEIGLKRLTSLVEPLILLSMGGFVGFVVLSIALPIFQAQSTVK